MCYLSKVVPTFRTDNPNYVSMDPPNTELLKYLDGVQMKIHKAVKHQESIPSVTYLVININKLYCLMSNLFTINTTRIHPNVCTYICYTEAGNDNDLACHAYGSYTMTNSCVPHKQYMKGHDTYDSYCYTEADNDSSKVNDSACYGHRCTMINPCVPHHIYMRDHDTYDDICRGE